MLICVREVNAMDEDIQKNRPSFVSHESTIAAQNANSFRTPVKSNL